MKSIYEQLRLHEGCRLKPYRDTVGKLTIGIGRNLDDVGLTFNEMLFIMSSKEDCSKEIDGTKITIAYDLNNGISGTDADYLLQNDVRKVKRELFKHDWFAGLGYVRMKVIIDMAFNLGINGLFGFRNMIKALSMKDFETAAYEMENSKWYKQVGTRGERLKGMMYTGKDYDEV